MDKEIKLREGIYWVGTNDRDTRLFENLWPLDNGVSYNAYLILDEKNVLIDTVKINKSETLTDKLEHLLKGEKLDYLVINHMEPDHSGSIKELINIYPDVKIIGNKKTLSILEAFYGVHNNTVEIKDGEILNIGKKELKFVITPMVHWPETMMTYEMTEKILFSGDAFGGFGSLDGGIFDYEVNLKYYEEEIRRYYSNIVGKYGMMVQSALKKLKDYEISMIGSTHGPIWEKEVDRIIADYDRWSRYEAKEGVVIVYGSMYGNTERFAEYAAREFSELGIKNIRIFDASKTHLSYIISAIWEYKGLMVGSCTYNGGIFPPIESLVLKILNSGLKNRTVGLFGTYAWSGEATSKLKDYFENMRIEIAGDPVKAFCSPKGEDFANCKEIVKKIANNIKEGN